MFRRLLWLVMGVGFGFGMSFWTMRIVKQTAARYAPERVSNDLTAALKGLGADLRTAMAEGREAMREREQELRASASLRVDP